MKTNKKLLNKFVFCILFFAQSHLIAQNLPSNSSTQVVCIGSLAEPYEVIPSATSSYTWSIIDQSTGLSPSLGIADITLLANDWEVLVDWTTAGSYILSVMETDITTSCNSVLVDLLVTVEDAPNAPNSATISPICLNDPNPTMSVSSGGGTGVGIFNWYSDASLSTLINNGSTYTDPIQYPNPGTYDYWVTEESSNGCPGASVQVSVTVTPLPTSPVLSNLQYEVCYGFSNPVFSASGSGGSNFNWYDASGNNLSTNSATYTSTEVNPAVYTYFVEEIVGSCTSPQTAFTFTIYAPPAAPSVIPSDLTICDGDIPSDFNANTNNLVSGTFIWYDDIGLTNQVGAGPTFTPISINPGTYTYWVNETDIVTSCVSSGVSVTYIINELPLIPIVTASPSAVVCDGDPNPTFTASQTIGSVGTNDFIWYDDINLTNQIAVGSSFIPTQTAVGVYTFYVTESSANTTPICEGAPLVFTFEIISLPSAPSYSPNPHEICFGDPNPIFSPIASGAGVNLIWYDDIGLTNQVGTGSTFTPPTSVVGNANTVSIYSYWVIDQPGTCVSPSLKLDLQINPLPQPGPIWHN